MHVKVLNNKPNSENKAKQLARSAREKPSLVILNRSVQNS